MLEAIASRRSIRKYKDKPVDEATLLALLESARIAPSGHNYQPWHFIVVRGEEKRRELARVSHRQAWMADAPVHIVCIADQSRRVKSARGIPVDEETPHWDLKSAIRDTAIAAQNMVTEAAHLGLGACWTAWFLQRELRAVLGIPDDKYAVCVLTVGYPDEQPRLLPRRPISELVHREAWGSPFE